MLTCVIFDWIRLNGIFVFVFLLRLMFSITRFSIPSIGSVTPFPYSVFEGHVPTGVS